MRKIPEDLQDKLAADPFYERCCITGAYKRHTRIEWHHNFIFAGRQVNEEWCVLPVAKEVHDQMHDPRIREECDWIMLNRADGATLQLYSKAVDLTKRRDMLNRMYGGKWKPFAEGGRIT